MQPTQARYTRLSYISRSVEVGMEFKATTATTESGTFAVPFISMPAVRALLRSVSGIHKQNVLSKSFSLITDKLLKLVERPVIELAVELFAPSLLNSDLAQILKSKYSIFRVHNLLGYAVVDISHKPSFPTRQTLQLLPGRLGAFGLQLFAKISITSAPIFDLLRVEKPVIRADCNIHYPTIYSKNFEIGDLRRIAVLHGYVQIEHFASPVIRNRRGLDNPAEIFPIMRWYIESCLDSSVGAGNCSYAMHNVDCNYSLIVSHCRERFPLWKRFAFDCLECFTSTISGTLHQRRREIGNALASKLVGCIVIIYPVPRLVLISPFSRDRECIGVNPSEWTMS